MSNPETPVFLCSDTTQTSKVDVCGTGIATSKIFLLDLPTPWPTDINETHLWDETTEVRSQDYFRRSRYLLTKPINKVLRLRVFIRDGAQALSAQTQLGEDETYSQGLKRLEAIKPTAYQGQNTLLICGHSARDKCCGTKGVSLADEATEAGLLVETVSHTAGHRFAPTLIDMPTGNSWAFVDLDLAKRIAKGETTDDDYQNNYRGWWGAKAGAQQLAVRDHKMKSDESILEVTTDEEVVIQTESGSQYRYCVSEAGIEEIPQCEVINGGKLKFRKLYSVAPVS